MITRRTEGSTDARPTSAAADASSWAPANARSSYFTDGERLYRLVSWLKRSVEPHLAELEDCRSLACLLVSSADLARMNLQPVLAGPDPAD